MSSHYDASLDRPLPVQKELIAEERAPVNLEEANRQLLRINADQAARIDQLTSRGRRLTLDELEALVHVFSEPNHDFHSCPRGSRAPCKHTEAARSLRAKMKARLDEVERRKKDPK